MSHDRTRSATRGSDLSALHELLEISPWYANLGCETQARVRAEMGQQPVPVGVALSRRGDLPHHWYGVISGLLKWSVTTADGHSITFGGLSPGSWFGEGTLLRGAPRPADVIALQASQVAVMPRHTFEWLYEHELAFNHFMVQQINERMHWFMESWAADRVLDADGQVKRALAGLFHPWLYPRGHRHIAVSQEEVANLAGVSRPRCNRALKQLQDDGLVKIEYGGLTVLDLDGLRRAAGA
jgi:CRP/FNR family cyclic AMP-dependent transcriptional regulator